jgi:hypothetical protein
MTLTSRLLVFFAPPDNQCSGISEFGLTGGTSEGVCLHFELFGMVEHNELQARVGAMLTFVIMNDPSGRFSDI